MKLAILHTLAVILASHSLLCDVLRDPNKPLPSIWSDMCKSQFSGNMSYIAIVCHLTAEDSWDLKDFRNWSLTLYNDTRISVDITCDKGGSVCLPWPYRAVCLDSLKVSKCTNKCYLDDYAQPEILATIPDTLRVFEGYDVTVQTKITDLINIATMNHPPTLDCGSLSAETFVNQGSSTEFIGDTISSNSINNLTDILTSSVQAVGDLKHVCRYRNMRVYDVSRKIHASSSSLYTTVVNSFFPELQTLNLSSTELQSFPQAFKIYRRRFPKLKILDLSHNNISRIDLTDDVTFPALDNINMTHNSIETIRNTEIRSFTHESGVIDVRENPLKCDCSMADFSEFLKKNKSPVEAGTRMNPRYSYLWSLTCVTPPNLKGRKISDLTHSALCNEDAVPYSSAISVLTSIAVILVIVVIAVISVIACRRHHQHVRLEKRGKSVDIKNQCGLKTELETKAELENV